MASARPSPANVLLRVLIGGVAGYFYASLAAVFVASVVSGARADRVIAGVVLAFLVHTAVIVAAFAARSLGKLAAVLTVSAAAMLVVVRLTGSGLA